MSVDSISREIDGVNREIISIERNIQDINANINCKSKDVASVNEVKPNNSRYVNYKCLEFHNRRNSKTNI